MTRAEALGPLQAELGLAAPAMSPSMPRIAGSEAH